MPSFTLRSFLFFFVAWLAYGCGQGQTGERRHTPSPTDTDEPTEDTDVVPDDDGDPLPSADNDDLPTPSVAFVEPKEGARLAGAVVIELAVEGAIQYDAAADAAVARTKLPESDVAGRATVFIFPDLNTGNNTYKAVQRSAGAVAIGPVLQGLNKPINALSRGALVQDIVNTVAITAIQAADAS